MFKAVAEADAPVYDRNLKCIRNQKIKDLKMTIMILPCMNELLTIDEPRLPFTDRLLIVLCEIGFGGNGGG